MDVQRPMQPDERDHEITDGEDTADPSVMTEGVGGMPDLEPEERATVSDVDGDNVREEDQPLPE
jgi:hypothetical protein